MTPEQASLRDIIQLSHPRTGLSGPFGPWLSLPTIAGPLQELGRAVRYGMSLLSREKELVILLMGAKRESNAEFDIHVDKARRAGVGWDVIRSIPGGTLLPLSEEEEDNKEEDDNGFSLKRVKECVIPALMREHDKVMLPEIGTTCNEARERKVAIMLFASELLDKNTVCNETYNSTRDRLDGCNSGLVKIMAIVGYYAFVSYTLNAFRIPLSVEQSGG
jgi:hypothetical protein